MVYQETRELSDECPQFCRRCEGEEEEGKADINFLYLLKLIIPKGLQVVNLILSMTKEVIWT